MSPKGASLRINALFSALPSMRPRFVTKILPGSLARITTWSRPRTVNMADASWGMAAIVVRLRAGCSRPPRVLVYDARLFRNDPDAFR